MWFILGIGLILWVIYDLIKGVTWAFGPIYKKYEPLKYWAVTSLWFFVAVMTVVYG
jgi:hypothetical protein